MKDIPLLQKAIKETHGCDSKHLLSVAVKEYFKGQTAWEGNVEVFQLINHQKAQACYAWSYREGNHNKVVIVLELPPVDSPSTAVQVAIAAKGKR